MEHSRRTWAEIDINALKQNFDEIKRLAGGTALMPAVKADAYGHSAEILAPYLEEWGAESFAVACIDEAKSLREIGITKPILILGYTLPTLADELIENNLWQCVFSVEYARQLSTEIQNKDKKLGIFIKIDSGMGRLGFDCRSEALAGVPEAIEAAKLEGFEYKGVLTHFAISDRDKAKDNGFTDAQFERFSAAAALLEKAGLVGIKSSANSAAICQDFDKRNDLCRPGIMLYGINPIYNQSLSAKLLPVMTLKTVVTMVKEIREGETVSYGCTYKADSKRKIATLAAGYADGYPRVLSNKGKVLINGQVARVVGRVCMDQMAIDVTDMPGVKAGDEVVLFGKGLPTEAVAEQCGTISHELLCGVTKRVPRIEIK